VSAEFTRADEVAEIVLHLIETVERFKVFAEHEVEVHAWFRDDLPKSKSKIKWATIQPITGIVAAEVNVGVHYYRLIVTKLIWDELTDIQKEALIYHELCHARIIYDAEKGEVKIGSIDHDISEFRDVIRVYGCWDESVQQIADALEENSLGQTRLTLDSDDSPLDSLSSITISSGEQSVTMTGKAFDKAAKRMTAKAAV
jgi:putative metallopeptidase